MGIARTMRFILSPKTQSVDTGMVPSSMALRAAFGGRGGRRRFTLERLLVR